MKISGRLLKIIFGAGALILIFFISRSIKTSPEKEESSEKYNELIEIEREKRAAFFERSEDSPIPEDEDFDGLEFFDIDKKFRIEASYDEIMPISFDLSLTDSLTEKYIRVGEINFQMDNQSHVLKAFVSAKKPDASTLFVPFADLTNGEETYAAGRYIDCIIKEDTLAILDFNLAYNPYCAYNSNYICPLPPEENFLQIPITAGEKKYSK